MGEKEIIAKLDNLKRSVKNKILRTAIKQVSKPVLQAAKQNAPIGETSGLKMSLATKTKTTDKGVFGIIGPRSKYERTKGGKTVRPVRYAHLMEKGTKFAKADPFLAPAVQDKEQIKDQMAKIIASEIHKVV